MAESQADHKIKKPIVIHQITVGFFFLHTNLRTTSDHAQNGSCSKPVDQKYFFTYFLIRCKSNKNHFGLDSKSGKVPVSLNWNKLNSKWDF
jgi:hypothetical protein